MRLFNTLTNQVEELVPVEQGLVKIYACGPTVYRYVHIGNLRTFLLSDLLRRALEFEGHDVLLIMNITDVGHMTDDVLDAGEDKMDVSVARERLSPEQIAEKYTAAFLEDCDAIGILRADQYPKATDHIAEMIALIERLIERGHAYVVGGSVYFDVHSFPGYGRLSGNTLDNLRAGHRDIERDPNKRQPEDFALWKEAGPRRLMTWQSPWGVGFPGWHIECSAMSMRYLGDRFDVHTGGNDLKFPHHEDEIAQSDGATGHQVISTWVHGGHLRSSGQKMAKSTGNVTRIGDVVESLGVDPLAFRYLCFQTRYRSEMDFSLEAMLVADRSVKRMRQRMADWATEARNGLATEAKELDARFRDALADDLDLPEAVVVLNETLSAPIPGGEKYVLLSAWDAVLGLDLERDARGGELVLPAEVRRLLEDRDAARAARDFARSDAIRDELTQLGYEVMDTPEGTRVRARA
ncbi:MAG TPA: cysteine--tRNA ligase [Actinomycetota bacterium]|nr:cysteine--tRNA ligase [Actinomycetota bacterium]